MKNKLLAALLSLAIAVGIWLYVVTVVSPNSDKHYYNIPVVMQSEVLLQERGLMITDTDTNMVDLHLEGSRVDLNKLSSSNITVAVDVSKIYEAGTHSMSYGITFPGDVASNAITTLSKNPGVVTVNVEERVQKDVPIKVIYSGTLPKDFVVDDPVMDVENVNIAGPKSVVDHITEARIQVDIEGRNESFSEQRKFTLCDKNGDPVDAKLVTTDVAEISITLKIMRVKEVALVANVIYGGGATEQTCKVVIDPAAIRVSGSDNILENLEQLELGTIDLSEIPENDILSFPIKLPEGVVNETGVTEATVAVQFQNLATKTLTVNNIKAINVPEGMKAELITKALEVVVRGPEGQIGNLKPEDITVTVDFADAQAGTIKLKAEITSSTAPDIGAVGAYTVSATVREE